MAKEKSLDVINANRGSFAVVSECTGFCYITLRTSLYLCLNFKKIK